ncbi:MAG: hypothetical protein ACREPJ_01165 [Rhodanobacteraceae bacterium]
MKILGCLGLAVAALALGACSATLPVANPHDGRAVAAAVLVQHNRSGKTTDYVGPRVPSGISIAFLYAHKNSSTGNIAYEIRVIDNYYGPRQLTYYIYDNVSVHGIGARNVKLHVFPSLPSQCTWGQCLYEDFVILDVSHQYLAEHARSGLGFKVFSRTSETAFFLPGAYIKAFLSVAS